MSPGFQLCFLVDVKGRVTSPRPPPLGRLVVSDDLVLPPFGHAIALTGIFQAVNCKSSVSSPAIVSPKLTAVSFCFRSQGVSVDPGRAHSRGKFPLITVHRH